MIQKKIIIKPRINIITMADFSTSCFNLKAKKKLLHIIEQRRESTFYSYNIDKQKTLTMIKCIECIHYLLSDVHPSTFGHRRTEFDHLLQPKLELVQVRLVLLKGGPKLGRIGETFGKTHNSSHLQRNFNIYERKKKIQI